MECKICKKKFNKLYNDNCYLCDKTILLNLTIDDDFIIIKTKLHQKKLNEILLTKIKNYEDIVLKDISDDIKLVNTISVIEYKFLKKNSDIKFILFPIKLNKYLALENIDELDIIDIKMDLNINKYNIKVNEKIIIENVFSNRDVKFILNSFVENEKFEIK